MAARHSINPNQLKMFMSADEITQHYQPLDADRYTAEASYSGPLMQSASERSSYDSGPSIRPHVGGHTSATRGGGRGWRSSYGQLYRVQGRGSQHDDYGYDVQAETDDELWERKAAESQYQGGDTHDLIVAHGERGTSHSLYESLERHGVHKPVTLGAGVQAEGSQGKPQVMGGHHRLAAMQEIDPHALIPVIHARSLWSAKEEGFGGHSYT